MQVTPIKATAATRFEMRRSAPSFGDILEGYVKKASVIGHQAPKSTVA